MESVESQIRLLIERTDNFKDQLNRFVSHLESEQRSMGNISKRVEDAHFIIKLFDEAIKKHERILLNDSKGLSFEIDRLKTLSQARKSNISSWISILSLITSIIAMVIMIIK